MRTTLFDFTDPNAASAWHAIDDRVMGGISRSTLRHDPAGHAVFEGTVSLERNGGFASMRSSPGERGLAAAGTCLIGLYLCTWWSVIFLPGMPLAFDLSSKSSR